MKSIRYRGLIERLAFLILANHAAAAVDPSVKLAGHAVLLQGREDVGDFITLANKRETPRRDSGQGYIA